jgi:DNA-directed RNA polymerase subunit M/transcription elongation factor TFIIS
MEIKEIYLENCLTTDEYNPSPNRFDENEKHVSERTIPLVYTCDKCEISISFKPEDFEKHTKSEMTNLTLIEKKLFEEFIIKQKLEKQSFLDFYCPNCKQATTFIFDGGTSGYWGCFEFKIQKVLVLEQKEIIEK